ncbi:iron ABC transporter permease, partial [bacterium]|nr:iron ABC transporter permease [bacterium]
KRNIGFLLSSLVLLLMMFLAISIGAVKIDIFKLTEIGQEILIHVRGPRVLLAALTGAALSFSGALFQYVMKNPLASSFTTGVSSSSAVGAVLAIMLGLGSLIPVFALAGGLTGLYAVYRISSVQGRVQPITMLLAGIVIHTFAASVISLMKFLSDDSVASIVFWLMGGFQAASVTNTSIMAVVLVFSCVVMRKEFLSLDIISFDDITAVSSGVNVDRLRQKAFFIAALLTAVSVGYAGIIGFVGLIIPHIIRLMKFVKASELIPLSLFVGAIFMVFNDLVARSVLTDGQELSVGIITSFIGGLFFLYLLIKRKKELFQFD